MKVQAKKEAIRLRKKGLPMGEIAKKLNVAKSSVSYWVRDVRLSESKLKKLKQNSHTIEVVEKRRVARLENTDRRRQKVREVALADIERLKGDPLWYVGVSLYWGEGGKTQQTARLSNSDPAVIRVMMKFFRETCEIPEEKFRGHLHTFEGADIESDEKFWSEVSQIPRQYFYKTYSKQSLSSKRKRKTLEHGTFQIYVHDSDFFFRLMTWIEYLKKL